MTYFSKFQFSECLPVNYLWPEFVDKLGIERAQKAVRESLDLQRMYGSRASLPVLLVETCGLALAKIDIVRKKTGFACHGDCMVLLIG